MKKVNVIEKDYGVFINNPNRFLAFSDFTDSEGINVVNNVNIIQSTKGSKPHIKSTNQEERQYIAQEVDSLNYFKKSYGDMTLYTFLANDVVIQDFTDKLRVANSPKGFEDARIDISHVLYINKVLSKKDLLKIYKHISKVKAKYIASLNLPLHINNIFNNNDFLAVLSEIPKDNEYNFDKIDFDDLNIDAAITESIDEAFERLGLSFGVLDYLVSEGILIGDLVEAGMDLLDDAEVTEELKQKMEAQILKSLGDINVIALLMPVIRTTQDFAGRIREFDDSVNLYSDKILALAIANQIAGTNAAFNFNLYSKAKPGIIYGLPPVLDDIFAGLIAGCITKVLEE